MDNDKIQLNNNYIYFKRMNKDKIAPDKILHH